MDCPLSISSLRLLIPPLRLVSAFMWQVTKRRSVKHYGQLEDFVCVVTEAVPEMLNDRQRSLLLLGLRAKITVELFSGGTYADPELVQTHLARIQSVCLTTSTDLAIEASKDNLVSLTQMLLGDRSEVLLGDRSEGSRLTAGAFDENFDAALQMLVCDFLSRLEELLPVPNFKQAAAWLEAAPGGVEDCMQSFSDTDDLGSLLRNPTCHQAHLGKTVGSLAEELLLASLSSPFTAHSKSSFHSQSEVLSEWVSHAHDCGTLDQDRLETEGVEVVIGVEMGNLGAREEEEGVEQEVCILPGDGDAARESEGMMVIGQGLASANGGQADGGGTNSIPAVLSLMALNQTPIVFIPQQPSPTFISLSVPALPLPMATRGQCGAVSPSRESRAQLARKTVSVPGLKPHSPQPLSHTLSVCPEMSAGSAVCHGEDSDTGDHAADSSQQGSVSPHLSSSASTASTLPGASHNPRRVAHKCPQCGKCFIYRSQVLRHLHTHKTRGTPHKCSQCGLGFRTPWALNDHKRSVCSNATFDCPLCGKAFPSLREQYRHRLTHKTNTCFQCGAAFKSKAELVAHLQNHRAKPLHQCCLCGKRFRLLSSLTNHKQTHSASGGFACTRCERVFPSARERDAHRQMHRVHKLPCPVCGEAFTSQAKLIKHQQSHPSPDGAERRYKCRYCEETYTGLTQLRIHQRSHMEKPYKCEQCDKAFSTLGGLHNHKGTHSGEKPYLCTHCGKSFRTKDGLEGHLRIHTGEKPFHCSYCGKRFTALAGLNVHVRRHTGERPYVCQVCGKGWPSGGDLQKHMRSHTGEKPYGCSECGKTFSISCHLTEHMRSHSGEKPFTCPECGKCLKRKFDLKKHMLSHSDTRPFPCSHCDKSYTRRTHLTRHLQTHATGSA
ncbi:zinc finger protein 835-like [Osmerus eperlanus]|uniref:zinc finger protein 835-like n=1 Tax=Osmerus eperlanus TaxID=29151 RepID=UPI002E0E5107